MFPKQPVALLLAGLALALVVRAQQVDPNFYAVPGVSVAQICRARGYLAEEHFVTSQDGYVLKLTRCSNPLINGGCGLPDLQPILLVHGLVGDPSSFMVNSAGVQAKDLSPCDFKGNASALAREPSAKVLGGLAMNCGYVMWFLSRRGTFGSQQKLGDPLSIPASTFNGAPNSNSTPSFGFNSSALTRLPPAAGDFEPQALTSAPAALLNYGQTARLLPFSFDPDFWGYSYDEQAKFDLPKVIDYVLAKTGQSKLAILGHSAGGALILMALSLFPELALKLTNAVLWAAAFALGDAPDTNALLRLEPAAEAYVGSVPPAFSVLPLQATLGLACATNLTQSTTCEALTDSLLGPSAGLQPTRAEYLDTIIAPAAAHEFAQLAQTMRYDNRTIHMYDYGPALNQAKYGQELPPGYNASNITLETMSLYSGMTDWLVAPTDVQRVLAQLTVPYKYTVLGPICNHYCYFFQDDNADTATLPSMADIQEAN